MLYHRTVLVSKRYNLVCSVNDMLDPGIQPEHLSCSHPRFVGEFWQPSTVHNTQNKLQFSSKQVFVRSMPVPQGVTFHFQAAAEDPQPEHRLVVSAHVAGSLGKHAFTYIDRRHIRF